MNNLTTYQIRQQMCLCVFNLIYDEKRNNKFTYVERKVNKKLLPPLQMANGNVINNVFSRNLSSYKAALQSTNRKKSTRPLGEKMYCQVNKPDIQFVQWFSTDTFVPMFWNCRAHADEKHAGREHIRRKSLTMHHIHKISCLSVLSAEQELLVFSRRSLNWWPLSCNNES
jgi:hypothetical protein